MMSSFKAVKYCFHSIFAVGKVIVHFLKTLPFVPQPIKTLTTTHSLGPANINNKFSFNKLKYIATLHHIDK